MTTAGSFDLLSDCDLLSTAGRQEVLKTLMSKRPLMLMCSPPCTMYSELMRLWNAKKMNPQVKALREKDAYLMVRFSMELCRLQDDAGRFYCYEHPYKAASWKLDIAQQMAMRSSTQFLDWDQCRVGLCAPGSTPDEHPIRKRTKFMTNSHHIQSIFQGLQCECQVEHFHVQGSYNGVSVSKHCQIYPPDFCMKVAEATKLHVEEL
ncbi:Reverse transcriptase Ty1/copia-type domain-containing protein [Durusdinium trenchii]|uniref:Reverse transcriptase Ty1/copia-type domain-containing protein n=1 Tax=Durusdinium trenchii TaxID=1381693 RepID=A0ABP0HJL2_9DINO